MVANGFIDMIPNNTSRDKVFLPVNFQPSDWDVLCGRGKDCYNWSGNQRFRRTIEHCLKDYQQAGTKLKKSRIVVNVVEFVRMNNPNGGGFVREIGGQWYEIGDEAAREKVGQTIRDSLIAQDPQRLAKKRTKRAIRKVKRQALRSTTIDNFKCSATDLEPLLSQLRQTLLPLIATASNFPQQSSSDDDNAILACISPELANGESREWVNGLLFPQQSSCDDDDAILACIPPELAYETEWVNDLLDSDSDCRSVSSEDFSDDIFNVSTVAAEASRICRSVGGPLLYCARSK